MSATKNKKIIALSIRSFFLFCFSLLFVPNAFCQQLVSQPFIGHTTKNEINAWCLFKKADTVFIRIMDDSNTMAGEKKFTWEKAACFRDFLPVNCHFDQLKENTAYHLQYSFDHMNFIPLISSRTNSDSIRDFSFLAGSCAFIGTGFNGILKPFTNLDIFGYMKNDSTDFMLWLGDNLYYVFEYHSYKHQLKRNIKTRLNNKLGAFLNSRQQYAIWDDHDYGGNNSDGSFKYKTSSLNVFQQFWCNPKNDGNNYYTFNQQDCQFFMLDDRYNNEKENIVLGKSQVAWLEEELLHSKAVFKFICIGMQALNPISTLECLYKTKEEYKELIAFIKAHHIPGILFISGDRHHGELMKIKEEGLYPLYDFTTSPLSMYPIHISPKSSEYINPNKVAGTYFPSYNYGRISVSGKRDARKCIIELKDNKGNVIWTHEITEQELK